MRESRFLGNIIIIIIGCVLIGAQSVAVVYVHDLFAYPDLLVFMFILILFHMKDEQLKFLFIAGFILGIIQGVWLHQKIGIASFYYMLITYNYELYKNIVRNNVQLIIIAIAAMIFKFILYSLLAFIYKEENLLHFLFSIEFLYQAGLTLAVVVILGFPINVIIGRKDTSYGRNIHSEI